MSKIEDIKLAPAPKDWKPNRDEAQRIATDKQLQRLTRDEQYYYFKNKKGDGKGAQQKQNTRVPDVFGGIAKVLEKVNKGMEK